MKNIRSTMLIENKAFTHVLQMCRNHKTILNKIIEKTMRNMIQCELSSNRLKTFSSVKYQERGGKYILVHYSIDPKIYESLLDIRKLRKLSISRLISDFIRFHMMEKSDSECCFKLFFSRMDSNQINYKIISQFSKENQIFTFIIQARLE